MQMQRDRGKRRDEKLGEEWVLWQTPGPHSMTWCRVQAKLSWNLCIWGVHSPRNDDSIAKPFLVPSLGAEPEAPLLVGTSSIARLCGCFWIPSGEGTP